MGKFISSEVTGRLWNLQIPSRNREESTLRGFEKIMGGKNFTLLVSCGVPFLPRALNEAGLAMLVAEEECQPIVAAVLCHTILRAFPSTPFFLRLQVRKRLGYQMKNRT